MTPNKHPALKSDRKLRKYEIQIHELNAEIIDLRAQVFKLRDELHAVHNSRVVGKIIRFRQGLGRIPARARHLVITLIHSIRVVVAPLFPAVLRRGIKRLYKSIKRGFQGEYLKELTKIQAVPASEWDKKRPLVTVVIPYYNRADTIDDTLKSLDWQTFTDFETILVDDGSTDPISIDKLKLLERKYTHINFVYQKNQGVSAARNHGIKLARGKYVICLDSDDMLDETFIEKTAIVLETQPDAAIATTWMDVFGVMNDRFINNPYDPLALLKNNMVITAAAFRKEAWERAGGYKSGIGYEDWDFWLTLGENGFWARQIPEALFLYRTSMQSRYVEDKDVHWNNLKNIRALHPKYKQSVKRLIAMRKFTKTVVESNSAFINLDRQNDYHNPRNNKENVLITIPWMTFGGAETLIYNYCREIKNDFNLSFITGLQSENEWEYKFKEITPWVYHLTNLFDDEKLYIEFVSNYISTRKISLLHIIHNGFTFGMLEELRRRHPSLKVAVTMFNDRVEYFNQSVDYRKYIDGYVSDNSKVAENYKKQLGPAAQVTVIPNGINCYEEFNPALFDREKERAELDISEGDTAVFFVGRLSEEKKPDVFVSVANKFMEKSNGAIKFFMIGDGPMRGEVEFLIKKHGITNLNYLGYKAEVARYFSAADVFVLPSSIEGFPLSVLEAMAMRVAVVASDVGAVAEVVESGKEGFVVKPGSVDEIAAAITKLSKDKNKLEAMKSSARQKVEAKYSNRILGANYKQLYNRLTQ